MAQEDRSKLNPKNATQRLNVPALLDDVQPDPGGPRVRVPTDIRSTAHTLAFIVGRFGGFASGYVVENANSIPFATTVLIIMAALSALGTLTLRETMGERLS